MVVVTLNFLYGELCFVAELANDLFCVLPLHCLTVVAIVSFLLRNLLKSIASQVKTCVAFIAVKHLVRIVVKTAETNFTVSLEKFFVV